MTKPDIISLFPRLRLSFHANKHDIIALVVAEANAEETAAAIEMQEAQDSAKGKRVFDENFGALSFDGVSTFPQAPGDEDIRRSESEFRSKFTNQRLAVVECGVCGRETAQEESCIRRLSSFEQSLLVPLHPHPGMVLFDHRLVHIPGIVSLSTTSADLTIHVCSDCDHDLVKEKQPHYSLARGCWVGDVPKELQELTYAEELVIGLARTSVQVIKLYPKGGRSFDHGGLQRGIRGTCSTFRQNIPEVVQMLEDKLLPLPPSVFSATLSVAFIGKRKISKEDLRPLFSISRKRVYSALLWLKRHNGLYHDINISSRTLSMFPENDVPREILYGMRYSEDESMIAAEDTCYTHDVEEQESIDDPTVIPLTTVGMMDNEGINSSVAELDDYAFWHLMQDSNSYGIRSGRLAMRDFNDPQTLMKSHPVLYPYGRGGFVEQGEGSMPFIERARWCMLYGDKRFRLHRSFMFETFAIEQKRRICQGAAAQVRRTDFARAAQLVTTITKHDIAMAAREETAGMAITNPSVRKLKSLVKSASAHVLGSDKSRVDQRQKIWGLIVRKSACFLWFTYSVNDTHDPVVQVIIGEDLDLDHFDPLVTTLNTHQRAENVARDPYGVAKYFQLVTTALFESLLGIRVRRSFTESRMGVFGMLDAYFLVKEVQGRGGLHGHNVLWLFGTPAASHLKEMFHDESFRTRVTTYLEKVVCGYLDGVSAKDIPQQRSTRLNPCFTRPPDPNLVDYNDRYSEHLKDIVLNSQIHICRRGSCLIPDCYGRERCKRRAPFELSEDYTVREDGSYAIRRTMPMLNNFNKSVSASLMCNNDIKLITNGSGTNDLLWYISKYILKPQARSYNQAALLAGDQLFPESTVDNGDDVEITERARKLLIRCMNISAREQEVAGTLVATYLMGLLDTQSSHRFVPLYWSEVERALRNAYSEFRLEGVTTSDNVMLSVGDGALFRRSQWEDYVQRNKAMEMMSFYEFITDTYEISLTTGRNALPYQEAHSKSNIYARAIRQHNHNTVAYFVGGYPPDARDNSCDEWYAAAIVALFFPVRDLGSSKRSGETWCAMLGKLRAECQKREVLYWIDNLQYRHDAEAASRKKREAEDEAQIDDIEEDDEQLTAFNNGEVEYEGDGNNDEEDALTGGIEPFQPNRQTELFAKAGMLAAQEAGFFLHMNPAMQSIPTSIPRRSTEFDEALLMRWENAMAEDDQLQTQFGFNDEDSGQVLTDVGGFDDVDAAVVHVEDVREEQESDVTLLPDQQRAIDIIRDQIDMQEQNPSHPPLRMLVLGEGGTGKSEVVKVLRRMLRKRVTTPEGCTRTVDTVSLSAFTGIAASRIGGSTTHREWGIQVRGRRNSKSCGSTEFGDISAEARQRLAEKHKWHRWIAIDEISMISCRFFYDIARHADIAKASNQHAGNTTSFGNMNVILFGDFFQFPPVTGKPLYNTSNLSPEEHLGRALFEQFDRVVILRDQVRIQDKDWLEVLQAARHGGCNAHTHLPMIRSLILDNTPVSPNELECDPWQQAVLITSRHALRNNWNSRALRDHCRRNNVPMIVAPADDVVKRRGMEPRRLTSQEHAVLESKDPKGRKLPDVIELAVGMPCMVTMNVKTEQDLANGTRGRIVDIILDPKEREINTNTTVIQLTVPPRYILFKPDETRAASLEGLPAGVFPIKPMVCSFALDIGGKTSKIERTQLPVTGGFAFTDYRSQGQTLPAVIVDLAKPPTGALSSFGAYVALSRSRGRANIRLLREFDNKLFTTHPSEALRKENLRLEELDRQTTQLWTLQS